MLFGIFQKRFFYRLSALFGWIALILFLASGSKAERLPVNNLTIQNGLPGNAVNRIAQDSRGFFWICTDSGLARFDGYGFTNFSTAQGLPSDRVSDFLETRSGEFWLATNGGLVKFIPDGTIYDRPVKFEEAAALKDAPMFVTYLPPASVKTVTRLVQDADGVIWVGTANGLFRLDNNQFQKVELPVEPKERGVYIYALFIDRDGAVWVGTANDLFRIAAENITVLRETEERFFRAFYQDADGRLWVGTSNKGLLQIAADADGKPQIARSISNASGNWINAVTESFNGKLWLATGDGLVEFDPQTTDAPSFEIYTRGSGIGYANFQCLLQDRAGNLWLGTRSSGIFRIIRRGLISFGAEDNIDFIRTAFACESDRICFAGFLANDALDKRGAKVNITGQNFSPFVWSLGRFDERGFQWLRPNFSSKIDYFGWGDKQTAFQSRTGEWWIATGRGLFRFPSGDFGKLKTARPIQVFDAKTGLDPPDVFRIYEDSRGDVWIAANGGGKQGFFRWERATEKLLDLTLTLKRSTPIKANFVSVFREDRAGNVWFGFYDSGVGRLRNDKIEYFDESNGVPRGGVNDIFLDSAGRVWLASGREGVARIDAPEAEVPQFVSYKSENGLSSNRTFALTEDRQGFIYIGTDRDINRIDPASGKIIQLTTGDRLQQQQIKSAFSDARGTLWFGTTDGLMKYVPMPDLPVEPPEILLTGIKIEGAAQKISALGTTQIALGEFSPEKNQIELEFTSLSATIGEKPLYQYKLNSGEAWSTPNAERAVNLAGLAAGEYKIEIRAVNSDGVTSQNPAFVSFRILPPFYMRWWFLTLAVLILATTAYGFYRFRLSRLLELERVRTRIATDLHDDIGANLTRISLLSEVAKQKSENSGSLLTSIADISRESVASMNDIVWAISPKHDSLLDLTRRMRRHAEEVFVLRDIDLEFHAPPSDADLKLSVGVRRDVLLIFKEAVNNAARHSNCSRVAIGFSAGNSTLSLRIEDNGQGFDSDSESDGQGLQSMNKRAAALGGSLSVDSSRSAGTTVRFEMSLTKTGLV